MSRTIFSHWRLLEGIVPGPGYVVINRSGPLASLLKASSYHGGEELTHRLCRLNRLRYQADDIPSQLWIDPTNPIIPQRYVARRKRVRLREPEHRAID